MCGFAVAASTVGERLPRGLARRMVQTIVHRGPDGIGEERTGLCQLAHCRLAVIDLTTGDQPITTPDGRFTIVFNGEIYNYREMRAALARDGVKFATQSDTEAVLAGYARHGSDVLSMLNGQFAFAIWDGVKRALFLARDRFGEKPLYWARTPDAIVAASDLRAIEASSLVIPELDPEAVETYLALGYVPAHRTVYSNVQVVRPGSLLTWQDGVARSREYWTPKLGVDVTTTEAVAEVRRLLERAVERQTLAADVDVGAFLSGGLDSTTITALMRGVRETSVQTFSAGFGDLIDELPFARAVARRYGTEHRELQVEVDVGDALLSVTDVYDEPFADSSNIPTFLLAEFASRHVKVVLSGDGGDELFGGYDWYTPLLAGAGSSASIALRARALKALARVGAPVTASRDHAILTARGRALGRRYADPLVSTLTWSRNPESGVVRYGDAVMSRMPCRAFWSSWRHAAKESIERSSST